MKKLLILVMVLAMASLASATLTVSISGPASVDYGSTGTYTISYTDTANGGIDIAGADQDIVATLGTIGGGIIIVPAAVPARTATMDITGINVVTGNYQIGVVNDNSSTNLGSPIATFVYTAPVSGTYGAIDTISLLENGYYDLGWGAVTGTDLVLTGGNVTLTPEPMTIALLGLGGLMLRRRMA